MTWTKLGDEFSDECANTGLSDAAYRTHVEAIAWIYRVERMDLHIPKHLLRRFVGSEQWESGVRDLVALDWWRDGVDHYELLHHADVIRQSIAAQQSKRARDKKAQSDKRRRDEARTGSVSDAVSADVIPDTDRQTDKQASTESEDQPASNPQFWKTEEEMQEQAARANLKLDHLPGRCPGCGFHVATQGHGDGCRQREVS